MKKLIFVIAFLFFSFLSFGQRKVKVKERMREIPTRYFYVTYMYKDQVFESHGYFFMWKPGFPSMASMVEAAGEQIKRKLLPDHPILITFIYELKNKKDYDDLATGKR